MISSQNAVENNADSADEEHQLSFFELAPDPLVTKLRNLNLMDTTPSQALRILEELKELL